MSQKPSAIPPRQRPNAKIAPSTKIKVVSLPLRAKGLRVNCDGCFVVIARTEEGTVVLIERNLGHELMTKRQFDSHYSHVDTSVRVEAKRVN